MKKILSILLFFLFLQSILVAQNYGDKEFYLIDTLNLDNLSDYDKNIIDSCLNVYHKSKQDTTKIKCVSYLCEAIMTSRWRDYQYHVGELLKSVSKKDISNKEKRLINLYYGHHYNNLGYIAMEMGNSEEALMYFEKGIPISEKVKDYSSLAVSYNNIGMIHQNNGDVPRGIDYFFKALKLGQQEEDDLVMALAYNNIAYNYHQLKEYDKALDFYRNAENIYKKKGDKEGLAVATNNISNVFGENGDLDSAKYYLDISYNLREEIGDMIGMSSVMNNYAVLYEAEKNLEKALEYHFRSYELDKNAQNASGVIKSINNIGNIYFKLGDIANAEIYAKKSMEQAREIGYPTHLKAAAQLNLVVAEAKGNYSSALKMYKLYVQMKDSINDEATHKATIKQQAKYEYEKQKAVDGAEHEKQLAIEQEAKEKQQILTYATAGGLGLVGIFLIFVFNRLKVTRKQKGIIEEAHAELGEKNKEILDSINYAKRIQSAILPPNKVVKEYLQESFILYKPKDIVAGDFYWLEHVDDKVLFAAADCTGHGVPGAMVSVVCNNGLNRSVREHKLTTPGEILTKTREIVVAEFEKSEEEVKDGMDIALCSLEGSILHYAGAHNPLWIIRNNSNEIEEIKADKQPIGKTEDPQPYTTHKLELQKGDAIYIFSDGYADQFGGEKGKKMKTANFKKLLLSIKGEPMEQQRELVDEAFKNWKGDLEQLDDICVIGVRI